jgi:hypothetical protein
MMSSDGLSLAMFEALRGLRDAVAPESGNLTAEQQSEATSGPDFEEFWQSYRNNEAEAVAAVRRLGADPQKREDYVKIFRLFEREKDAELVARLATTVLQKSADVDERVSKISGMDRTRAQQLERIEDLLHQNAAVEKELQDVHELAKKRRDQVRKALQEQTCEALGMEEYKY